MCECYSVELTTNNIFCFISIFAKVVYYIFHKSFLLGVIIHAHMSTVKSQDKSEVKQQD